MELNLRPLLTELVDSGVTKAHLAEKLGCDPKTIGNIIGRTEFMTRAEVCDTYGVSNETISSLMRDNKLPKPTIVDGTQMFRTLQVQGVLK